jgi:hypothetical protein
MDSHEICWELVPPEWGDGGLAVWNGVCETCGMVIVGELGNGDGPYSPTCDNEEAL